MSEAELALGLVVCCEHGSSFLLLISIRIKKLWGERWTSTAQRESYDDPHWALTVPVVNHPCFYSRYVYPCISVLWIWHEDMMSAKLLRPPMWDVVSVTDLSGPGSGDLVTRNTGHRVSKLSESPGLVSVRGMLCWPGDTWAVLSLVPPTPLPPDIPLQCLRHQVNGLTMATPAWRESLQPIYPVNNFNQIHYPDKSVINCHILHAILFLKIRKGIPNNTAKWKTALIHTRAPRRETGGTVCHYEAWLTNFCCRCEWSQQVQKQFWSFITFHRCDTMTTPHPLPPGHWEASGVPGGTRQKTSWRKVYNPSTGHNERGRGRRETWPHKNSVYANPSPLAFNYLGELMNSNGTIYAATTKLETFER